jgi:hypothetical protein
MPDLTPVPGVPGVDYAIDQVKRRQAFVERHGDIGMTITSPRENGTRQHHAKWDSGKLVNPGEDESAHEDLGTLLDYLEARFDHGASG